MAPPNQSPTTRNSSLLRRERSASFHGRTLITTEQQQQQQQQLRRPKTQPDLLVGTTAAAAAAEIKRVLLPAKVLVNVTVQRSLGPLQVLASTEWKVEDLVVAAIKQYRREDRRPPLLMTSQQDEPSAGFTLHYSQFSLQSLDPKEKLIGLGSRNFFLFPNSTADNSAQTTHQATCSLDAGKESKIVIPWLRFMNFLF